VSVGKQELIKKLSRVGTTLGKYLEGKIYRGIVTGLNDAFVIDAETRHQLTREDRNSAQIIKPFLIGKDVKRYEKLEPTRYLIFTRRGIAIDKYPAIKSHLLKYKDRLMPKPAGWQGRKWVGRKPGTYRWYEIQDTIEYYEQFDVPKIIYPNICKGPEYTFDNDSFYTNQKCFIIPRPDKYLLGLLNSSLIKFLYISTLPKLRGGFFEPGYAFVKDFPIRTIDFDNPDDVAKHDRMVKLVERMLELHKRLAKAKVPAEKTRIQRQINTTDSQIDKYPFIQRVKEDCKDWKTFPWFRGEPAKAFIKNTQLLPKVYRAKENGTKHVENQLLQFFRMKSQSPELGYTPERGHTDQWLFLARHVGLPTRLLDWTEGALVAVYFALIEEENEKEKKYKDNPVVWMLNPTELNRLALWQEWKSNYETCKKNNNPPEINIYLKQNPKATLNDFKKEFANNPDKYKYFPEDNVFPITWHRVGGIGHINIRGAWEKDAVGTELPVAIHPTNIHPRMSVQKSCFTVHGKEKKPLNELLDKFGFEYLKKYIIDGRKSNTKKMLEDLRMLGISHATLFPDLDGLAKDLEKRFQ